MITRLAGVRHKPAGEVDFVTLALRGTCFEVEIESELDCLFGCSCGLCIFYNLRYFWCIFSGILCVRTVKSL